MNTEEGSIGDPALPYVAHLGRWLLARGEALRFSSRDLSAFYFQLGVPASRWPLQAVGPRVPLGWLTGGAGDEQPGCWADLGPRLTAAPAEVRDNFVQPVLATVMMGDLNGVTAAQRANVAGLRRHELLQ